MALEKRTQLKKDNRATGLTINGKKDEERIKEK